MCVFALARLSGCIKILTCVSASVSRLKRRSPPLLLFYSHLLPPKSSPLSPSPPIRCHLSPICSALAWPPARFILTPLSSSDPPSPCTSPLSYGLRHSHQLLATKNCPVSTISKRSMKCIEVLVFLLQCQRHLKLL